MTKYKKSIEKVGITCLMIGGIVLNSQAQGGIKNSGVGLDGRRNTITTAVPFLMITPEARGGGMGDVGVATPNDANALHWNMAKYPFNDRKGSVSLSYTPWLRNLVPDISLGYLTGYYKINDRSAAAGSLRYFSLGQIQFTDMYGNSTGNYVPNELAMDIGYASKLSEHFSLGIAFRYIRSDLAGGFNQSQTPVKPGNAFSGDITSYYSNKTKIRMEGKKYNINYAFGAAITNIGSKISYTSKQFENFIPINLRIGAYGQFEIDKFNTIALTVDLNKLLVPTSPIYKTDSFGTIVIENGKPAIANGKDPDVPVIQGMLQSFTDAPGGWKEEMHEINISTGLEYWYDKQFALRAGYFYEHPTKGNRKYLTFGAGFRFNVFGLDVSYLIPFEQRNPLERTLRFSLMFDLDAFASQNKEDKPIQTTE
ncbi:MAG: type IX secretion system outer membrane channel protein PorV [Bacteroidota bacterium]|nr:type IX secretion system outer membrane channel protein PorV [Bacteroidota bacterium]